MLGAIIGDIIGSVHEGGAAKVLDFKLFEPHPLNPQRAYNRFTDDTVLTLAVAAAIKEESDYATKIKEYARKYPNRGYGGRFTDWIFKDSYEPYNSFGNGSAMRVSPVSFAFDRLDQVLLEAYRSATVTHNHPEGIKGAQATATAGFMAKVGQSKEEIKQQIEQIFGYDLSLSIDQIRPSYKFDVSCQGSVPQAIRAFIDSENYESCIRLAVSLGGDTDTLAAIAGGIAQAFYKKIPENIVAQAKQILGREIWEEIENFQQAYHIVY